jgi:PAS domain S-box-containing protein
MMQRSYPSTRSPRWFAAADNSGEQVARIASGIVLLTGILVLIGWELDLTVLKSIMPGLVTMKVNTATCLILAGTSLGLQTSKPLSPIGSRIANGCAIGTIAIALATICEYLWGWQLGIDELLIRDLDTVGTLAPGRMGINTAVNFCLTGVALWLINCQERQSSFQPQHRVRIDRIAIAQILAVVAALIALQAIFSYAYHVQPTMITTSMALHTTIAFEILCAGILGLKSDRGFMRSFTTKLIGGTVARRFLPTAIIVPLAVGWLVFLGLQAKLYDPNFALSLMSISMVTIWLAQIRINAGMLNRIDYDRIRSNDRMQASEERLKLALQGARQGAWDFDVRTQNLHWDEGCQAMFGLSPAAVVTVTEALDRLHSADRGRVAEQLTIATRNRGEFAQEYRIVRPDGTVRWVLSQGCCYGDPTGESDRMLGTMMDITDRKQVQLNERFLHELTRRLRQVTDADELQDEATKSLGEYLNVDRVTWFGVDWSKRLATIDRDWRRSGLDSHVGVYAIADFLPPELQVALFAGESVVTADVHPDPSLVPYVEAYQQLGIQAFAWIPCFNESRWVATLSVNTQAERSWRDDEIALLQAVAAQIWPTIEQTRAVQALRLQQQQTRAAQAIIGQQSIEIEAIYRSAPIGLCFVNRDLQFVRINEQLAEIDGISVSGHLGRSIGDVLPELAETIEPLYRQVIESGEPILNRELSGITRAQPGVLRYWLCNYYPQKDAANGVIGVNVMVQEITDRKRQEAALQQTTMALRASERKFSAIFNQTFELIGLLDANGVVLEINQTALDSLVQPLPWRIQARASEIVGTELWQTPWWRYFPHLQHQLRAAIDRAKGGEFVRYEIEFPSQLGTSTPTIDFSVKPVFDECGEVATLIVEGRDITAIKQTEAALREGEERFRTLADNMSQLAWMTDASGGIFWYNQRWFDYTGTTLAQVQGWDWQQVHHPEHVDRVVEHFRQCIAIGTEWEDTFPLRGRDGTYRWFLSRAIPICDTAGQVVRWFGTNTDITEQQTALRELKQAQADLGERNQELDSFVHVVAHDLKAPLRGIANLSQWIEDDLEGAISPEIQKHTSLLRSRVARMEATIDGLLDYARVGRIEDPIEPVAVSHLLAEVIDSICPPPTFKIKIASSLPTIQTKRLLLSQVFTNLISNGIKHHDRADGSIQILGRDLGDFHEFFVADDGPGIDPEQHDRVFEIFQAMNPQNRADSTGIGLAIVKKIIEAEGGTIRLESQVGKGTTFYFTWPKRSESIY